MATNKINNLMLNFESLGIFRGLLKDPVIEKLYLLIKYLYSESRDIYQVLSLYNDFYYTLMESNNGYGLKKYIVDKILFCENVFAKKSARENFCDIFSNIKEATSNDLDSLEYISTFTSDDIKQMFVKDKNTNKFEIEKISKLAQWNKNDYDEHNHDNQMFNKFMTTSPWSSLLEELSDFYRKNGWGMFARYKGFTWDGNNLKAVEYLDPIKLSHLINYERQKSIVIKNTLAFLKGYRVNNILLYGSKGTGKSSTVKAILNEYYNQGLRVIEISKDNLHTFPKLIEIIKDVPLKFIIFIDDLTFEDSENNYNQLKAVLEGGLEARPDNVVIYATSNRRHLVKETFSDRMGFGNDDIHFEDSLQEKLSLADRFGIVVTFSAPNQKEYLEIVDAIAKSRGIEVTEELHQKAIQWEMNYNGKSPRTARQFIDWIEMNIKS